MNSTRMKATVVLTILLISLISISTAVGLKASSDSYSGQCGVELSVPAPGILKNDAQNPSLVQVVNPESITIDPKYGTITVNADGSFVYDVPENIGTSAVVTFTYTATDGTVISNAATVKILVSCRCHGAAPDVKVCLGTEITPEFLMSEGAGCFGCDSTGVWDLSAIPDDPEAGVSYQYTVSCPGCSMFTGHVIFEAPCEPAWQPFTVCEGTVVTEALIRENGQVSCLFEGQVCDTTPEISDINEVDDHWEYTITCQSECGPTTDTGIVNICLINVFGFDIEVCSQLPLSDETIIELGQVECAGCSDNTPIISDVIEIDRTADMVTYQYTITCNGCTAIGVFTTPPCLPPVPCSLVAPNICGCTESPVFPLDVFLSGGGGCGPDETTTMDNIDDSAVDYSTPGVYPYTLTCYQCPEGPTTATGYIKIVPPLDGECVFTCC